MGVGLGLRAVTVAVAVAGLCTSAAGCGSTSTSSTSLKREPQRFPVFRPITVQAATPYTTPGPLKAFERSQTEADRFFGRWVGDKQAALGTPERLRLAAARRVISTSEGEAGLIPGTEAMCFIGTARGFGNFTTCIPLAVVRYGFSSVTAVRSRVLVTGVVPNRARGISFSMQDGSDVRIRANRDGAYMDLLPGHPRTSRYL